MLQAAGMSKGECDCMAEKAIFRSKDFAVDKIVRAKLDYYERLRTTATRTEAQRL